MDGPAIAGTGAGAARGQDRTGVALALALAALAAVSLAGMGPAAARIPDGAARLELLGWTGTVALLLAIPAARLNVTAWATRPAARWAIPAQPVLIVALVAVAALVQALPFHGMPQFADSWAELFQARILAAGRLWLPSPPRPDLVRIANVVDAGGRWYSQYPVGNPALLALGILAHVSWLPAALIVLVLGTGMRALARECAGESAAALTLLLALASPTLVLSAAAGMSQATAAALGSWVLALTLRLRRYTVGAPEAAAARLRPARRPSGLGASAGAGLLVGLMAAVRPMDAAVLALVVLGVVAAPGARRLLHAGGFLVAAAVGVAPLLVVNTLTTGHPLRFGYAVLWGSNTLPGFGMRGGDLRFGPAQGFGNTLVDLGGVNLALLEWPVPVLLVLAGIAAFRARVPGAQRVLLLYLLAHVAAYAAYYHHDFFYGARFLVPIVPALLVVLADGLVHLARRPLPGREWKAGLLRFGRELIFIQAAAAALLVAWPRLARAGRADVALTAAVRDAAQAIGRPRAALLVDDGWGSRLFGEMWRLGVGASAAERFYATADACRLEWAIERTEEIGRSGSAAEAELARLLIGATPGAATGRWPARGLRLPPEPLPWQCSEQVAYDRERQRAPFAPLLWVNDVDDRGVVFWRDPGPARLAWLLQTADRPLYRVRVTPGADHGVKVGLEPLLSPGPLRLR